MLEHKEIALRAPEPEDLDILYSWENNTGIWHLSNTIQPFSKQTLRNYLENASKSVYELGQLRFMIVRKDGGEAIGTVDLFDFDPVNLRAGIGILIADEGDRKKGYAKAALELMINYSRYKLGLNQLWCNILEENKASIKLFTGLDFKLCGIKQQWIRDGEDYKNEILFQLILK